MKVNRDGLVVERETATDMVCIRLVKRKVAAQRWLGMKITSSSLTSGFTSLSILGVREIDISSLEPDLSIDRTTDVRRKKKMG